MYNQRVIQSRLNKLAEAIRLGIDPIFEFTDFSIPEVEEWNDRLDPIYDKEAGTLSRGLSPEEESHIRHELSRCKADFLYWATRYAFLKDKNQSLIRFNPTAVQTLLIERIGNTELAALQGKTGDGILLAVLKARQLGVSTISDILIAHRVFFYGNTTAMIAADSDDRTPNLYEMVIRVYENLPWWLKPASMDPKRDYRVKNKQIYFADQDSVIRFGSSANMQGGDSGEAKGSIGTGMTLPLVHLSELALWENPYQINDALMPSIPMSPRTFVLFESTAKGRDNWWHETWERAKKGLGRLQPVFIPWYTDPATYRIPAPTDWVPSEASTLHADRVRVTSHRWVGKTISLTRDQLYWWERTRAEYKDGRILNKFLAEYAYDDESAFQASTVGVFPSEMVEDMRARSRGNPIYIEIKPKMDMKREL